MVIGTLMNGCEQSAVIETLSNKSAAIVPYSDACLVIRTLFRTSTRKFLSWIPTYMKSCYSCSTAKVDIHADNCYYYRNRDRGTHMNTREKSN